MLRHPEYYLHFIPTSGSLLNQIERLFSAITEGRVRRGTFRGVLVLLEAIDESIETHKADPKPLTWVADADSILDRIKKVCERASDSGHKDEASTRFSSRTAPPKGGVPRRSGLRSPQSAAINFARQSRPR